MQRQLALHAIVETRHVDDHALVRALADRLALVASLDAKADGAAFDAGYLRARRDAQAHRRRRKVAHVEPDAEALMPFGEQMLHRRQRSRLDHVDHHRRRQHRNPPRADARRGMLRRDNEVCGAREADADAGEIG